MPIILLIGLLLCPSASSAQDVPDPVIASLARVRVILTLSAAAWGMGLEGRWITGRVAGGVRRCAGISRDSLQPGPGGTIVPLNPQVRTSCSAGFTSAKRPSSITTAARLEIRGAENRVNSPPLQHSRKTATLGGLAPLRGSSALRAADSLGRR